MDDDVDVRDSLSVEFVVAVTELWASFFLVRLLVGGVFSISMIILIHAVYTSEILLMSAWSCDL